jgi:hypothetical protein
MPSRPVFFVISDRLPIDAEPDDESVKSSSGSNNAVGPPWITSHPSLKVGIIDIPASSSFTHDFL